MSNVKGTAEYAAMGVGVTVFLWIILAFFPSLMVSLSITDTFFDWNRYETISGPKIDINGEIDGTWSKQITLTDDGIFASACFWFSIVFIILAFIQVILVANIRHTWGIVVPWFLLSIHPFIYWLGWLFNMDKTYTGINWMPW